MTYLKSKLYLRIVIPCILAFVLSLTILEVEAQAASLNPETDYSTLSVGEIQKEVNLLYEQAREAYAEDDLELSKFLFYKILEFDPQHPGANKYLDYLIPKKIYKAKLRQGKDEFVGLSDQAIEALQQQKEDLRGLEKEVVTSEKNKIVKEKFYDKAIKDIPQEGKKQQKLELAKQKRYEAEKKKQEAIQKKEKERLEKEKLAAEKRGGSKRVFARRS
jgi:hypothetical protein